MIVIVVVVPGLHELDFAAQFPVELKLVASLPGFLGAIRTADLRRLSESLEKTQIVVLDWTSWLQIDWNGLLL